MLCILTAIQCPIWQCAVTMVLQIADLTSTLALCIIVKGVI